MKLQRRSQPVSDSAIVAKATIRAAERLGLTSRVVARVLGVSEATISRMRTGDYPLAAGQKPFELAVMFVRLYRSLDAIVGGDDKVAGEWLRNKNTALNARPLDLIQSVTGLVNVVQYLDARRALI
ncbi:MAG TPA: antitoxin Xre/MbcA/ParS toxin-binding domain-containing protein [Pseudolabrys sp.]|nr:antitoxin Xre/MbcA/ParS toxin-binding domain-containing protein [Pseudolabrys sp.]